jgi:8-oxo-dGTP pyrophosphatase MutT (NUDIX family)
VEGDRPAPPAWPEGAPAADGWRVEARRSLVHDRYLHLVAERVVTGSGAVLDPYYVLDLPDWVIVVALTPDGRMVLVRQWRQGARAWVLEPPGGVMDPGEDACRTAARELREETGYAAARFRVVATPWSDPSRNSNRMHVVLAEGAMPAGAPQPDTGEEMRTELLPVSEVVAGLSHGLLTHGVQLGGVMLALAAAGHLAL